MLELLLSFLAVIYCTNIIILIYSRRKQNHKLGLICKLILGVIFTLISIFVNYDQTMSIIVIILITSLLFNAFGDIMLALERIDPPQKDFYFLVALSVIGLSQVTYFIFSILLGGFNPLTLLISALITFIIGIVNREKFKNSVKMKVVLLYTYLFTLLTVNSIYNVFINQSYEVLIFGFGILLYWLSDLVLFRLKFSKYTFGLDVVNKALYYSGQLTISFTFIFYKYPVGH